MAAEAPLVDLAVRRAVEGQAHVLQVDDRVDGLARQDLGRVLVDEVVATLDGVEHVPLPVVLLLVAERGADAALRGAGMGARRVELGEDGRLDAVAGELEGGPQAGAARADDHGRVVVDGRPRPLGPGVTGALKGLPARARERQHHDRAQHEQDHARAGTAPQHDRPCAAAADVVLDHRPNAEEGMEEHQHQQRPVDGAPEELVPALVGDELGGLLDGS